MKLRWRYILPSSLVIIVVCVCFLQYGILLAAMLALPWAFFMSFVSGPLYALLPNLPNWAGIGLVFVVPIIINSILLYKIGVWMETKIPDKIIKE